MPHPYYPSGNPRFNHVALSVSAGLLGAEGRADICRFWGEVFGFEEMPSETVDRRRLILSCVHWDQFIFLIAEDDPMRCPRMDHFGFAVGERQELLDAHARAADFRAGDGRVDLIDVSVDDRGPIKIHSFYVGYLLPMLCEIQYWEMAS